MDLGTLSEAQWLELQSTKSEAVPPSVAGSIAVSDISGVRRGARSCSLETRPPPLLPGTLCYPTEW